MAGFIQQKVMRAGLFLNPQSHVTKALYSPAGSAIPAQSVCGPRSK